MTCGFFNDVIGIDTWKNHKNETFLLLREEGKDIIGVDFTHIPSKTWSSDSFLPLSAVCILGRVITSKYFSCCS